MQDTSTDNVPLMSEELEEIPNDSNRADYTKLEKLKARTHGPQTKSRRRQYCTNRTPKKK